MDILLSSLGSLLSIGLLLTLFKRSYRAKEDPFFVVGGIVIFLMVLGLVALFLSELSQAILDLAGAKISLRPRISAVIITYFNAWGFLAFGFCLYLVAVRLPTIAINERRQRKELAQLGWREHRPGERLDVSEFTHLFLIGINSWKSEDRGAMETLQRGFRHDDWTVQVFFLDDIGNVAKIRTFSPDVKSVWPTPIVSEYQDGVLIRLLSGKEALTWMKQA